MCVCVCVCVCLTVVVVVVCVCGGGGGGDFVTFFIYSLCVSLCMMNRYIYYYYALIFRFLSVEVLGVHSFISLGCIGL